MPRSRAAGARRLEPHGAAPHRRPPGSPRRPRHPGPGGRGRRAPGRARPGWPRRRRRRGRARQHQECTEERARPTQAAPTRSRPARAGRPGGAERDRNARLRGRPTHAPGDHPLTPARRGLARHAPPLDGGGPTDRGAPRLALAPGARLGPGARPRSPARPGSPAGPGRGAGAHRRPGPGRVPGRGAGGLERHARPLQPRVPRPLRGQPPADRRRPSRPPVVPRPRLRPGRLRLRLDRLGGGGRPPRPAGPARPLRRADRPSRARHRRRGVHGRAHHGGAGRVLSRALRRGAVPVRRPRRWTRLVGHTPGRGPRHAGAAGARGGPGGGAHRGSGREPGAGPPGTRRGRVHGRGPAPAWP